jgi:predicted amidophosphoribosyltransferase
MVTAIDGVTYRIAAGNEPLAFAIFGQWGARVLAKWHDTLIVPVPASTHTIFDVPFTGSRLADAVAARFPKEANIQSASILAFKVPMPRASEGQSGGRDKVAIQNGLKCVLEDLSGRLVVLVDDVCTTGAHLRACADFVRGLGATVSVALCLARTVNSQHPSPLQVQSEDIEDQLSFFST